MAIIQDGVNGAILAKVSANLAMSVSLVPTVGGQYSAGFETTSLAFTSNVVVWDFRNGTANLVLITNLQAQLAYMAVVAYAATGLRAALQLFVGRAYTAVSATNRTALTMSTNNCKLRTSYATAGVEIGFANLAAGITGGTITEDATALATNSQSAEDANIVAGAAVNQQTAGKNPLIWRPTPFGGPIVLAQNEGIRIRYLVTTAAAVIVSGMVNWSELGSTTYP